MNLINGGIRNLKLHSMPLARYTYMASRRVLREVCSGCDPAATSRGHCIERCIRVPSKAEMPYRRSAILIPRSRRLTVSYRAASQAECFYSSRG